MEATSLGSSKQYVYRWEVSSRTVPDKTYVVSMKADGTWGCACGGWIFNKARPRPDCHHIKYVKAHEPVDKTRTTPAQEQAYRRTHETLMQPPQPYFVLQTRRAITLED